jgi:hypothetical protein
VSYPDLSEPIRTALIGATDITTNLPTYLGSYPVFTRRPAPEDADYPMIIVSPDIAKSDQDGLNDQRPIITRDVVAYGQNDTVAKYDVVELLGRAIHDLFHRRWNAITVSGWKVVQIIASGPIPAPVDDDQTVARLVSLRIELAKQD